MEENKITIWRKCIRMPKWAMVYEQILILSVIKMRKYIWARTVLPEGDMAGEEGVAICQICTGWEIVLWELADQSRKISTYGEACSGYEGRRLYSGTLVCAFYLYSEQ